MVLGSTGSIGRNTLDIIGRMPGEFRVAALSCRSRIYEIAEQAREFKPEAVAVSSSNCPLLYNSIPVKRDS